jgi:hypothetical protein
MDNHPSFLDPATQAEIINRLSKKLRTWYVYAEVA